LNLYKLSVSPFVQINDFNKKAHDFVRHIIIAVGEHVAGWWRVAYRMDTAVAVQYASSGIVFGVKCVQ